MADKLGLDSEVHQLKLGQTFSNHRNNAFHTIRYDFKPASVDINKIATVDVGNNNQVTVTVPHLDGAGIPQTLFKGSQRPYQKECVLIIDRVTGEITLEKLSSNIQVKKTRAESYKASSSSHTNNRPQTPVEQPPPITQRNSSKTKVTSGSRRNLSSAFIPKHSPLHASPSHHPSPSHNLPPPKPAVERHEPIGQTVLPSLPMLGIDPVNESTSKSPSHHSDEEQNGVGFLSDSSSSSSSDSGSSDSDSDQDEPLNNGNTRATNGKSPTTNILVPDDLLSEDLRLSESATDSD